MALDFPNSPTNGQVYTDTGTGEQWVYEAATNSWTSKGLVNTTGGLQYKGDVNITATPPTGVTSGSQYSVNPGGTANAAFGPGVTGNVAKGLMVMYTGTGWIETNHAVPDATPVVKGLDTRKWDRTGTVLSPATAGDVVSFSAGFAALPGLTPVGDANTGIWSPGADVLAVSTGGSEKLRITNDGKLGLGTTLPWTQLAVYNAGTAADVTSARQFSVGWGADYGNFFGYYQVKAGDLFSGVIQAIDSNTPSNLLLSPSGGKVGIGTTSPGSALEINAAAATSPFIAKINAAEAMQIKASGVVNITSTTVYADNTAALAGGLVAGDIYRKADGTLMITF